MQLVVHAKPDGRVHHAASDEESLRASHTCAIAVADLEADGGPFGQPDDEAAHWFAHATTLGITDSAATHFEPLFVALKDTVRAPDDGPADEPSVGVAHEFADGTGADEGSQPRANADPLFLADPLAVVAPHDGRADEGAQPTTNPAPDGAPHARADGEPLVFAHDVAVRSSDVRGADGQSYTLAHHSRDTVRLCVLPEWRGVHRLLRRRSVRVARRQRRMQACCSIQVGPPKLHTQDDGAEYEM